MARPTKTEARFNATWYRLDDIQGEINNEQFLYETLRYLNEALEIPKERIIEVLNEEHLKFKSKF